VLESFGVIVPFARDTSQLEKPDPVPQPITLLDVVKTLQLANPASPRVIDELSNLTAPSTSSSSSMNKSPAPSTISTDGSAPSDRKLYVCSLIVPIFKGELDRMFPPAGVRVISPDPPEDIVRAPESPMWFGVKVCDPMVEPDTKDAVPFPRIDQ